MKTILLLFFTICHFTLTAQEKGITTEEEYNYLTKGYAEQLEKGGDMKEGYELVEIDKATVKEFSFQFQLLKQKSTGLAKALLIIAKKDKDNKDKIRYLCLPFHNGDLLLKYIKDKDALGITMGSLLDMLLSKMLAQSIEKISNRCK